MTTPLQAWPTRRFRGRPGYSSRHFAALGGAPDDPLSVAARIVTRAEDALIAEQAQAKIAAGEDIGQVMDWQTAKMSVASQAAWARLCASFDAVIDALESAPGTNAIRRLLREARLAKEARHAENE